MDKINILIKGSIICDDTLPSSVLSLCPEHLLSKYFDFSDAVIIDGDLNIKSIYSPNSYKIVATGNATCMKKGGDYAN